MVFLLASLVFLSLQIYTKIPHVPAFWRRYFKGWFAEADGGNGGAHGGGAGAGEGKSDGIFGGDGGNNYLCGGSIMT